MRPDDATAACVIQGIDLITHDGFELVEFAEQLRGACTRTRSNPAYLIEHDAP
jgi:hypothetical protein